MASCCDTSPAWVEYRGADIQASLNGADLSTIDFFLIFYVERRNAFIKVEKSEMIQASSTKYTFTIPSETTKNMELGQYVMEMWRINGTNDMEPVNVFFMKDSKGKTEV